MKSVFIGPCPAVASHVDTQFAALDAGMRERLHTFLGHIAEAVLPYYVDQVRMPRPNGLGDYLVDTPDGDIILVRQMGGPPGTRLAWFNGDVWVTTRIRHDGKGMTDAILVEIVDLRLP